MRRKILLGHSPFRKHSPIRKEGKSEKKERMRDPKFREIAVHAENGDSTWGK